LSIVYEVENEEAGVIAQVIDWLTITHAWRVVIRDTDADERVPDLCKSFKHLGDAEAYADTCVGYS
tara:strand:- start:4457 stop:4654 length:198 start_codon:yes stop_codon:yes gene_type:complete